MSGPVEGGRLWGGYIQGVCPEKDRVCPEGVPYHVTYPMMHVILPTHPGAQTDTCKKHYLPTTTVAGGKYVSALFRY